jgi:hypothetical protein
MSLFDKVSGYLRFKAKVASFKGKVNRIFSDDHATKGLTEVVHEVRESYEGLHLLTECIVLTLRAIKDEDIEKVAIPLAKALRETVNGVVDVVADNGLTLAAELSSQDYASVPHFKVVSEKWENYVAYCKEQAARKSRHKQEESAESA